MIKATKKLKNGNQLIILGLSDGNVAEMKKHNPVLFNLKDLDIDEDLWICVSYKSNENNAAFPEGFTGIGLAFSDKTLKNMYQHPQDLKGKNGLQFCVFRGKTEAIIEEQLRPMLGVNTTVRHEGYAPSDVPPSMN